MSAEVFYITGTDTEVGKTFVTTYLLNKYKKQNKIAIGLKPIASDAKIVNNVLVNQDALLIKKHSSLNLDYNEINPFVFQEAIAPHIAAKKINQEITLDILENKISKTINKYQNLVDYILIEGAGGYLTPINFNHTFHDLINKLSKKFTINIILVVKIKLGCINHALLTSNYIINNKLNYFGWIANDFDNNNEVDIENIETLKGLIKAPLFFSIPSC
tara:strand:+ start:918 stop:1568 length:651 start_codon:yes stop_codon:yes gene_type:complete